MMPEIYVRKLADGLGYGDGNISNHTVSEQAGEDVMASAEALISTPEILVPIDRDEYGALINDDGCGDGRKVKLVFAGHETRHRSLNRSKVFGGGAAMVAAIAVGNGHTDSPLISDVFHKAINTLNDKDINFGAHTADHVHTDKDCGCGAIDKAPDILRAAVHYRDKITNSIGALGVTTYELDEVLNNYAAYVSNMDVTNYSGRDVLANVIDQGKIVKELEDAHLEGFVVLNTIEGYTVNQAAVREVTDGKVQIFAVDVHRLQKYAVELYDDPALQQKAFLSELVYTLATAAVLTKGDLPVYVVEPASQYATVV